MSNYTSKVAKGSIIIFVSSVFAAFISYFFRLVLVRYLSVEEFGLFYAVFNLILFLIFSKDMGLQKAMVKHISEYNAQKKYDEVKTVLFSSLLFQVLITAFLIIGIFAFSGFLSGSYFKNPLSDSIINVLLLYVFFNTLFIFVKSVFLGLQEAKIYSFIEPVVRLGLLASVFVLLKSDFGVLSPAWAFVICNLLGIVVFFPFIIKKFNFLKYKVKNFRGISANLFAFGIPVFVGLVGTQIINYLDTLILTKFRTLAEVGIYNVAQPTALVLLTFAAGFYAILFPVISELWALNRKREISNGLKLIYKYSFLLLIPFVFSLFAFSKYFLLILFGSDYASGYMALQILLVGVMFFLIAQVNNNIISGIGKPRIVTKIFLVAALINTVLNFIFIPFFGMEGAAAATSISYLYMLIVSIFKIKKYIEVSSPWKNWLKNLFVGLLFVLSIYIIKELLVTTLWLEVGITVFISFVIYALLAVLFKLVDLKEIKDLITMVRK